MANAEIGSEQRKSHPGLPEPLLALASEITWSAATDGTLITIHPAAKNLYGVSAEELIQNPKLRIEAIHPDDRQRVIDELKALPNKRSSNYVSSKIL